MGEQARWLMLLHQLPAKPAYARVKVWRMLQDAGAVSVKNSAYVLPQSSEARTAFAAILREITRHGGDGLVSEAQLMDGMQDKELRALFNAAREDDYGAIAAELRQLGRRKDRPRAGL